MKDFTVFISILLKSKKADVEFTYADGTVGLFSSAKEMAECLISYDIDHIKFYINTGCMIELREDRFLIHTADWEKSKERNSYTVESTLWDISDVNLDIDNTTLSFDVDGYDIVKVKIKSHGKDEVESKEHETDITNEVRFEGDIEGDDLVKPDDYDQCFNDADIFAYAVQAAVGFISSLDKDVIDPNTGKVVLDDIASKRLRDSLNILSLITSEQNFNRSSNAEYLTYGEDSELGDPVVFIYANYNNERFNGINFHLDGSVIECFKVNAWVESDPEEIEINTLTDYEKVYIKAMQRLVCYCSNEPTEDLIRRSYKEIEEYFEAERNKAQQ